MFPVGLNKFWQRISKSLYQTDENTIEVANGVNPQTLILNNRRIDKNNFSRLYARWINGNTVELGTESTGRLADPYLALNIKCGYNFILTSGYGTEVVTNNKGVCFSRKSVVLGFEYSPSLRSAVVGSKPAADMNAGGREQAWLMGLFGGAYPAAQNAHHGTGAAIYCGYGVTPTTAGNGGDAGSFDVWLNSGGAPNTSGSAGSVGMFRVMDDDTDTATFTVTKTGLIAGAAISLSVVSKTSNYTCTPNDSTVTFNASGAPLTCTLETAVGAVGRIRIVVKTDSSANTVTIDPNAAETINGASTLVLSSQWDRAIIQSDGTNWIRIA